MRRLIVAMLLLTPIQALAQQVVTLRPVNVRAGPDRAFPIVTPLHQNTPVHIFGCLSGWQWCDIASGRARGWVQPSYLTSFFRDRTPVITFSLEAYWDEHYQRRSWYSQRSKWLNWEAPAAHP